MPKFHSCVQHLSEIVNRIIHGKWGRSAVVRKTTPGWDCTLCHAVAAWEVLG